MYKFDDRFGFSFERERVLSWIKITIKRAGLGSFRNNNKNPLFSFLSFSSFFFLQLYGIIALHLKIQYKNSMHSLIFFLNKCKFEQFLK